MSATSSEHDWVAEVFRAHRDCGESIAIVFGQVDARAPTAHDITWHELQHDQYDGVSGLASLLAKQGLKPDALPVLREGRPSWFRRIRGLLSVLRYLSVRRQAWNVEFDWKEPEGWPSPADRVAWILFDEDQTRALLQAAKSAGSTVNTFLLTHLDAVVCGRWVPRDSERRWMLPVNLRGAVQRHAEAPPHMSLLAVDMTGTPTPGAVQTHIDGLLRQGQHWGMWPLLHAGRVMGAEGMRKDIRKRALQGHSNTGMFSNLGVWNVAGGGSWLFCPAITRVYPIGAGCITVNGRLALTVQLHTGLGATLAEARETLEAWTQSCLDAIEQTHTRPAAAPATGPRHATAPQPAILPDPTGFSSER